MRENNWNLKYGDKVRCIKPDNHIKVGYTGVVFDGGRVPNIKWEQEPIDWCCHQYAMKEEEIELVEAKENKELRLGQEALMNKEEIK